MREINDNVLVKKDKKMTENVDICVVGGGLAGTFAAIAAKRYNKNLKVLLIEKFGFLGGMATAGYVYPFMRYSFWSGTSEKVLIRGLFDEILMRLYKEGYIADKLNPNHTFRRFDPMMLRIILDEMINEAGVKVLFYTLVNKVDVEIDNTDSDSNEIPKNKEGKGIDTRKRKIVKIYGQTKMGEIEINANIYIDASGDADLIFHAGGLYKYGREEDGLIQPATTMFRMGNIRLFSANSRKITKLIRKEKAKGNLLTPRDNCLMFKGHNRKEQHFNQTRVAGFDFTDPYELTKAEMEGRAQIKRFVAFLRKKVKGYKNSVVMSIGTQIGIRETRRIVGDYILSEKDLMDCKLFEDRIALGNYPIDVHDPKGSGKTTIIHLPKPSSYYSIPFRSLIPINLENVLVAGRPISTTHLAHSAIRIMPICSAIGQAAGIASAIFSSENLGSIKSIDIGKLQNALRNQNAVLEI